jgi:GNAT superfamily N-acetyltransferase
MDEIRKATSEGAPPVARLANDLGYAVDSESISAAIGRLQPNDGAVFVAGTGERLTGWIHIYRSHVLQTEPFAGVGGLVVDPQYRGNGVGHRLLKTAERWADTNGLTVIRPRSNTIRFDAHHFYERRGYSVEKTSYTFVKQASASGSGAGV